MHGSDLGAKGGRASLLTRRGHLGWAALVLLCVLTGTGYALGLLGDWRELRSSLIKIVTLAQGDGDAEVSGAPASMDSGARQVEASRSAGRERADSSPPSNGAASGKAPANPPAEASERAQVERLMKLMEQSEATWAEGYKAERERADGIARDLATVRAELADRVAAEAALRAEVERMAKLLEAKEAKSATKPATEQEKSTGVVKDTASGRAELADGPAAAETSARAANEVTTATTTGPAMTDRLKTIPVPNPLPPTTTGRGDSSTTLFGFGSTAQRSVQVPSSAGAAKRERRGRTSIHMRTPANGLQKSANGRKASSSYDYRRSRVY